MSNTFWRAHVMSDPNLLPNSTPGRNDSEWCTSRGQEVSSRGLLNSSTLTRGFIPMRSVNSRLLFSPLSGFNLFSQPHEQHDIVRALPPHLIQSTTQKTCPSRASLTVSEEACHTPPVYKREDSPLPLSVRSSAQQFHLSVEDPRHQAR